MAIPIIVFLAIAIRNNFFLPFYNYISIWIVLRNISIVLIIAYVLTRTEGTKFENIVGLMVMLAFIPVFMISFFKLSYGYLLPWIAGIVMNFVVLIGYNGWLCPHNWNSGETTRFCTKCHRTEINTEYLCYGTYQFQNIQTTKDLNKKYKKEHSIFPFLISLFFIEFILYFLMMNLKS